MKPSTIRLLKNHLKDAERRFHEKAHWLADQQIVGNTVGEWDQKDFIEKHHKANVAETALRIIAKG